MLYGLIEIYNEIEGFDGYYINDNYKKLYRRIILTEMITRNKIKKRELEHKLSILRKLSNL